MSTGKGITVAAICLVLAVLISGIAVLPLLYQNVNAGLPASKHAVDGGDVVPIQGSNPEITTAKILSAVIKTAEQKDLVMAVSAECSLVTDTKIRGKGNEEVSSMDKASIKVWVEVDGVVCSPAEVTFAERIQTLKGKLSEWIIETGPEGEPVLTPVPEEIELILDTTTANSFNFLAYDVGSGEHTIDVYATIELVDQAQEGVDESASIAGVIGDRTLVIHEIRLGAAP